MKDLTTSVNRRSLLKATAASGLVLATPTIFSRGTWAQNFANAPTNKSSVTLGFNVPQTGAYANELRAYQLAVKHINGEGDGGMLNTMKPFALEGNGILGKKVDYVTGDT